MKQKRATKYFLTFPSWIEGVVSEVIKSKDHSARVEQELDGGIIFSSTLNFQFFVSLPFVNNCFQILNTFQIQKDSKNCLATSARWINSYLQKTRLHLPHLKGRTFRVIASYHNTLSKLPPKEHKQVESLLSRQSGWHVNRVKPDNEFWILQRSEGLVLFMLRLSKNPKHREVVKKWELSVPIAFAMCRLAKINKHDTILDPFVWYGGIPKVMQKYFQSKKIIVWDIDNKLVQDMKHAFSKFNNILVQKNDACKLDHIASWSIDKVVTDPPWWIFEKIDNMGEFYKSFLIEFDRILKPQGKLVLLTAKKEILEDLLNHHFKWIYKLEKAFHILVSGKKSAIYVINKI